MANVGALTAELGSRVWGTRTNFNGLRVLASLLQRRCSSPEANQTLRDVWLCPAGAGTLCIHFPALALWLNFATCEIHFASNSCLLLYWQRYYATLQQCCTRLAGNTGRKNDAKNRHLHTIAQICRAEPSQLRHVSTIGKNVKQQYLIHMSQQYGELRLTSG